MLALRTFLGQIELCERTGGIERTGPWRAMKIVAEYLDKAIAFEQMAAEERTPNCGRTLKSRLWPIANWRLNEPRS